MKNLSIFFIFLILFSVSITAYTTIYEKTGSADNTFTGTTGTFNIDITNVTVSGRPADEPRFSPLVSDLDGDGIKEIIIIVGERINIFTGSELTLQNSFDLNEIILTPPLIKDFDGDGNKEILIIREKTGIENLEAIYLNYSSSTLALENNISSFDIGGTDNVDDYIVGCNTQGDLCILHVTTKAPGNLNAAQYVFGFNYTQSGFGDSNQRIADNLGENRFCPSKIKNFVNADLDEDGTEEFILSVIDYDSGAGDNEFLRIQVYDDISNVSVNASSIDFQITKDISDFITTTGGSGTVGTCESENAGQYITSPVVFDFDNARSGLEIVIGANVDGDSFRIFSFDKDGTLIDQYPLVLTADGISLSNPVIMNAFPDSPEQDVCVMGFNALDSAGDRNFDLLCASERTSDIPNSITYQMVATGNITADENISSNIIHASQMSSLSFGGSNPNLNEIVTSFGTLRLIHSGENAGVLNVCTIFNVCFLELVWDNPKGESATLPIEYNNIGKADILALTETNLWYIDDGFSTSDCSQQDCITTYTINPCIDATWKENTSVEVTMQIDDVDEDNVQARVILYHGDLDAQQDSNWSVNASSGTTFTFGNLKANKSISVSTLRLVAREGSNNAVNETIDIPISVSSNGVVLDECITTFEIVPDITTDPTATDTGDNAIVNTLDELTAETGLGRTAFWFFAMIIIGVAMIVSNRMKTGGEFMMIVGITFLIEFFMLILGFMLGIISLPILISVIVVAIVIIGFFVAKMIIPQGG